MADATLFHRQGITVDVRPGPPPVDQSQEVAQLAARVQALTQQVQQLTAEKDALAAKIATALPDIERARAALAA